MLGKHFRNESRVICSLSICSLNLRAHHDRKTLTVTIDSNDLRGCFDVIVHIVADAYLTDWTSFRAFIVLFQILQESDHTRIGNVYRSLTL